MFKWIAAAFMALYLFVCGPKPGPLKPPIEVADDNGGEC